MVILAPYLNMSGSRSRGNPKEYWGDCPGITKEYWGDCPGITVETGNKVYMALRLKAVPVEYSFGADG
jgi:hypothetical protein